MVRILFGKYHRFFLSVLIFFGGVFLFFGFQLFLSADIGEDITISTDTTWEAGTYSYNSITISNSATLTLNSHYTNDQDGVGVIINLDGDLTIEEGSKISGKGTGYPIETGEGKGTKTVSSYGGGAGHGGNGGRGHAGTGGGYYGLTLFPTTLGSGGVTSRGGKGGSAIKIAAQNITINGSIDASASEAQIVGSTEGSGGAGGSIYIIANSLSGSGTVKADGTDGKGYSGGGGGGRIAIYADTSEFNSDNITANKGIRGEKGTATRDGQPGTIFIYDTQTGSVNATNDVTFYADQGISRDGTPRDDGIYYFNSLTVSNNATVTIGGHHTDDTDGRGVTINLDGDLAIEEGSKISANGQGYAGASGPGKGKGESSQSGSGGSYGGLGGPGYSKPDTSETYGADQMKYPYLLGSGGGNGDGGNGGSGGGAVNLRILGSITNHGSISANGAVGTGGYSSWRPGGGSGGSVFVFCNSLSGIGTISANGGSGAGDASYGGGGGGGGRIAIIYSVSQNFSVENISVAGGIGSKTPDRDGAAGSIYISQQTLPPAEFILKNPNNNSTEFTNTTNVEFIPASTDVTQYKDALSIYEYPPTFYGPGWKATIEGKELDPEEGEKTIKAWLKDEHELISSSVGFATIILDQTDPVLSVSNLPLSTDSQMVAISGTVADNLSGIVSLAIQKFALMSPIIFFDPIEQEIEINDDGSFSTNVSLSIGDNQVSLTATDGAGNTKTENFTIARETASDDTADSDLTPDDTTNDRDDNSATTFDPYDPDNEIVSSDKSEADREAEKTDKGLINRAKEAILNIGGCLLGNCLPKVKTAITCFFLGGALVGILYYLLIIIRRKRRRENRTSR
jgi:hypothetical protein